MAHNSNMRDEFNVKFGERIKYFRNLARLSQEELAEKIGCERNTLSYIEIGKNSISFAKFKKLCKVLDIEPYQLFLFDNNLPEANRVSEINKLLNTMTDKQLGIVYNMLLAFINLRPDDFKKPISAKE